MMKKHAGLTLIEVLVASLLLFMALGIAAIIFQHSNIAQQQASRFLMLTQMQPSVVAQIESALNNGQSDGDFELGDQAFNWKTESETIRYITGSYDEGSGGFSANAGRVSLKNIAVTHVSSGYVYQFEVLVWLNNEG